MKRFYTLILIALIILLGCGKDDNTVTMVDPEQQENPDDPENPTPTSNIPVETVVKIVLPEDSTLDLVQTKLVSFGEEYQVEGNGFSKALLIPNAKTLVYLRDQNDKILLLGFLDETENEISIASTTKASFFFSLGTSLRPKEIQDNFFKDFEKVVDTEKFNQDFEALFVANPNCTESEPFLNLVETKTQALLKKQEVTLTNSIDVGESGDLKSGIKIYQAPQLNSITFENTYRRRTHVFAYKTAYKEEENGPFIPILPQIAPLDITADVDQKLKAAEGLTSVIGAGLSLINGDGIKYSVAKTGPLQLNLKPEEIEAKYAVRVIGPTCSLIDTSTLTKAEFLKWNDLMIDTMLYDIILPTLFLVLNESDISFDKDDIINQEAIFGAFTFLLNSSPQALELLLEGKFGESAKILLKSILLNAPSSEGLWDIIYDVVLEKGKYATKEAILRAAKLISFADILFLYTDVVFRIKGELNAANELEEWEVVVKQATLNLSPAKVGVQVGRSTFFEAKMDESLPDDQYYEYEWSTSAAYGVLEDESGQEYIETGFKRENTIRYKPVASPENLPDNASDMVFVNAYLNDGNGRSLIGRDSSIVNIYKTAWRIKPTGVTVSGKTKLTLQIVDLNNNPINNDLGNDYKIVWNSSGKYGTLGLLTGTTLINRNTIEYDCLDTEVAEGKEQFSASIYRKTRYEGYRKIGDAEAEITVENEENKITFPVSASDWESERVPEAGGERLILYAGFEVPFYEDAISYEVEILDYNVDGKPITGVIGDRFTWTNERRGSPIGFYEKSGNYGVTFNSGSVNTISDFYPIILASVRSANGRAQVTITLED